ncbi:helix-turn-helix domain-containing protein [Actinokineospora sp.]|uniref:helix-turn-helix domain-containing protein n=1 Tax=Actinokineospora sp. TaxID=1872133 RepID=UPI004037A4FC
MAREATAITELRRSLGERLTVFRHAAGLTQTQLAKIAYCDRTTVAHIEKGRARAGERFWRSVDAACQADGALLAAFLELDAVKAEHERRTTETDLAQARSKAAALRGVRLPRATSNPTLSMSWEVHDVMRQLHRTDVGPETVEQLQAVVEEMCCDYAWRDAAELKADAHQYLHYLSRLLKGSCTLREHRELLVLAGWLILLIGCIDYDTGQHRQAELHRAAAFRLGQETGHGEIVAWSFEMSAWFALTQDRLESVAAYSNAGAKAAPNTSVVVQLAAQSAKAAARMGRRDEVAKILDDGYRLLSRHERPHRPENHFVIDPQKWDFYAMDCYRLVGEDQRAADHAREVLRISRRPDGTDRSPMRATEARLTLAVVALRQGDLDLTAEWTRAALSAPRKSVEQLIMVTSELEHELRRLFPNDSATRAIIEPIDQTRDELNKLTDTPY